MELSNFDIGVLVVYVLICIGIGLWSARKKDAEEYLSANRSLNAWQFMATVVASVIGGGAIVVYTAYVYEFGLAALMTFIGTAVSYLVFIYYGKRLRRLSGIHEFHTLSDYFYLKFGKTAGVLSASIIFIVYMGYLINQFVAGSSILSAMSGWSYEMALTSAGIVILIYLSLGGFRSVVRTDIFQYGLMLFLFFGLGYIMLADVSLPTRLLDLSSLGLSLSITFIVYGICASFVAADLWQRVYAAKDEKALTKGLILSAIFVVIGGLGLSILGLSAAVDFPGIDPNQAAAYGLQSLAPSGLIGLGLVLMFAAIMSSADTVIFVLATNIAKDYLGHHFYDKLSKEELAKLTRALVIILSILGIVFAYFFRDIIQIILTVTGVLFALVPPVVGSFHFDLKTKAVNASMVSGIVYVAALLAVGQINPELAVASVGVSLIVLIIGQKIFK